MVNNGSGSMMVMMYFAIGIGMGGYDDVINITF